MSIHILYLFKNNFSFLLEKRAEKEGFEPSRRDKRPTPLAGAPLQPLEYFSWSSYFQIWNLRSFPDAKVIILDIFLFVNVYFFNFFLQNKGFLPYIIGREMSATTYRHLSFSIPHDILFHIFKFFFRKIIFLYFFIFFYSCFV